MIRLCALLLLTGCAYQPAARYADGPKDDRAVADQRTLDSLAADRRMNAANDAAYGQWLERDKAAEAARAARATADGDPLGDAAYDPYRGHIYPDGSSYAPIGGGAYVPQ